MFLPFAFWFGWALSSLPGLLPYAAVAHAVLDSSLLVSVLIVSLKA